jgi:hypothetical protein
VRQKIDGSPSDLTSKTRIGNTSTGKTLVADFALVRAVWRHIRDIPFANRVRFDFNNATDCEQVQTGAH